ncbi:Copia protein (Gag-int-pol protein), partial [Daphnia magna]
SVGTVQRYKARFVAKGYTQRLGLDYAETYAPVVKLDSLQTILSIAAHRDLDMIQLDVCTAFLYRDVEEELYVRQPEDFISTNNASLVCRLHKGLYGLKQASRLWNSKFDVFLTTFGFISSQADPCVYLQKTNSEFTILAIWVDDGIVCSNST